MRDLASLLAKFGIGLGSSHDVHWRCDYTVTKYRGEVSYADILTGIAPKPYEVLDLHGNLLCTAGASSLWNGLVTAGLATPFNSTNAQIAVGDGSTAATAADTDLGAAAGSSLGGGITGATNASPIVLTTSTAHGLIAGQVCLVQSVGGNTNANQTWEISAVTSTTITLLNSSGNASYTSGGTVKQINKYRQLVNGAPSVSTNQVQFVAVFGTANANHPWNEWSITTGGAATNKQAAPPPTLLNHAVPSGGLGSKTSSATWTFTTTLSLS
jgi:hypothetical protein